MESAQSPTSARPVRIGLVGAGPWASMFHAPLWAAGPETALAAVWARRAEAAESLAAEHGAEPAASFEALLDGSDAIAFAVAPEAQWELAIQAARAGKPLVLEKPIADTLGHAQELASAVEDTGVGSMIMFTVRFSSHVRDFLRRAMTFDAIGARVAMLTPAFLGGPFAESPWRRQRGALADIGPHAFDVLTAAMGRATRVSAHASSRGWIAIHVEHENGAASEVVLSCHVGLDRGRFDVEMFGSEGELTVSAQTRDTAALHATIRSDLVDVLNGAKHPCDVRRGLEIQRLVDAAERSIEHGPISLGDAG